MRTIALLFISAAVSATAAEFKAGLGRVLITPKEPVRMSGYSLRTKPSEGAAGDLWAKALAVEDRKGTRVVMVSADILVMPSQLAEDVAAHVKRKYGLERDKLVLSVTHTHAAPEVRPGQYAQPDSESERAALTRYRQTLATALVQVIGAALGDLAPADLALGHTRATFAINRRQGRATAVQLGVNPQGPTDPDVPVIIVRNNAGKLRGIFFGYACHNTTLGHDFYQISGDYAGVAQAELEKEFPGTTAVFIALCGGDQNPDPRGTLALANKHGAALASAVSELVRGNLKTLRGPVRTALVKTELRFGPHTRETFQSRLKEPNEWRVKHARYMLSLYDENRPIQTTPYPVHAVRFGKDLAILFLGGEVVVDYGLRAKRELAAPGEDLVVAAYSNDVMCYIPTLRVLREGGYEPDGSMLFYGMPVPFDESVEETVFTAMGRALEAVGRRSNSRQSIRSAKTAP
jgi:neutral ceramidase